MCEVSNGIEAITIIVLFVLAGLLLLAKSKIEHMNDTLRTTNRLVGAYKNESIASSKVIDNLKEVTTAQRQMITFLEERIKKLTPEEPEEDNGCSVDNFI